MKDCSSVRFNKARLGDPELLNDGVSYLMKQQLDGMKKCFYRKHV